MWQNFSSILNFKIGNFPFTYLGIMISPKRLSLNLFRPMVSYISNTIAVWNHNSISKASRVILINSSNLSVPLYYLSSYLLLDNILDSISRQVRNFLWVYNGNRSSIHLVSWNIATLDKSKRGLGIKNLKLASFALFVKHIMSFFELQGGCLGENLKIKICFNL